MALSLEFVAAILEGLSIGALALVFGIFERGELSGEGAGRISAYVAQLETNLERNDLLLLLLAIALVSQLARSAFLFAGSRAGIRLQVDSELDARTSVLKRILDLPFAKAQRYKAGDLTSTMEHVSFLGLMISRVSKFLGTALTLGVYLVVLVFLSLPMSLAVATAAILVTFALRLVRKRIDLAGRRFKTAAVRVSELTLETVQGLRVIHSFAQEDLARERVQGQIAKMRSSHRASLVWGATIVPLVDSIAVLGLASVLVVGVITSGTAGGGRLAELGAFVLVLYRSLPRLRAMNQHLGYVRIYWPFVDRVGCFVLESESKAQAHGKRPFGSLQSSVEFRDVTMQYDGAAEFPLQKVSFSIEKGQFVALVGESGAGKSTAVDLILGLYQPIAGAVLVDGVPLNEIDLRAWRGRVAVVAQETFLFHATVAENIAFGLPGATRDQIELAAHLAYADGFIEEMDDGYDTVVGDRGYRLSGGQRQRIGIARAILRRPDLLLLDEATSELDSESEARIQVACQQLSKDRTVVAIAHRLSTVVAADKIIVLDRGEVAEIGRHEELVDRDGIYARFWRLQGGNSSRSATTKP